MKKIECTKINKYPKKFTIYTLAYLLCAVLSCTVAFGVCYAYFSDKVEKDGNVTTGNLSLEYINETETDTDITIYISRDGDENLIKNSDDSSSYYTYFMPGDSMIVRGEVENNGNIPAYVLMKVEVEFTYNDNGTDTTETETVWYNLSGTKVVDSNSDGKYDTASSLMNVNDNINLSDNANDISYVLSGEIDNDYAEKTVKITITLCGHQANELTLANGYTDLAVQATNSIIAG